MANLHRRSFAEYGLAGWLAAISFAADVENRWENCENMKTQY